MEENKNNNISKSQIQLIQQLYRETGYDRAYPENKLAELSNEEAQKHIDFLLKYKRSTNEVKNTIDRNAGFDKVSFAMIYKLVRKAQFEGHIGIFRCGNTVADEVLNEYLLYKQAETYARNKLLGEVKA